MYSLVVSGQFEEWDGRAFRFDKSRFLRIARITELRDIGKELRVTVNLCPSEAPILNDHLWRIREELDIEQFEFSRNHWAVKERDLFSVLRAAEQQCDVSSVGHFEERPLPAPTRAALISARNVISEWSHTEIDDLLLEVGNKVCPQITPMAADGRQGRKLRPALGFVASVLNL